MASPKLRRGCPGLDRDLEGVRFLGAVQADGSFVGGIRYVPSIGLLSGFRGGKGLQPFKVEEAEFSCHLG